MFMNTNDITQGLNDFCSKYFHAIQDIGRVTNVDWNEKGKIIGAVLSLLTVIIPLAVGITYAVSSAVLKGRIKQNVPDRIDTNNVTQAAQSVFPLKEKSTDSSGASTAAAATPAVASTDTHAAGSSAAQAQTPTAATPDDVVAHNAAVAAAEAAAAKAEEFAKTAITKADEAKSTVANVYRENINLSEAQMIVTNVLIIVQAASAAAKEAEREADKATTVANAATNKKTSTALAAAQKAAIAAKDAETIVNAARDECNVRLDIEQMMLHIRSWARPDTFKKLKNFDSLFPGNLSKKSTIRLFNELDKKLTKTENYEIEANSYENYKYLCIFIAGLAANAIIKLKDQGLINQDDDKDINYDRLNYYMHQMANLAANGPTPVATEESAAVKASQLLTPMPSTPSPEPRAPTPAAAKSAPEPAADAATTTPAAAVAGAAADPLVPTAAAAPTAADEAKAKAAVRAMNSANASLKKAEEYANTAVEKANEAAKAIEEFYKEEDTDAGFSILYDKSITYIEEADEAVKTAHEAADKAIEAANRAKASSETASPDTIAAAQEVIRKARSFKEQASEAAANAQRQELAAEEELRKRYQLAEMEQSTAATSAARVPEEAASAAAEVGEASAPAAIPAPAPDPLLSHMPDTHTPELTAPAPAAADPTVPVAEAAPTAADEAAAKAAEAMKSATAVLELAQRYEEIVVKKANATEQAFAAFYEQKNTDAAQQIFLNSYQYTNEAGGAKRLAIEHADQAINLAQDAEKNSPAVRVAAQIVIYNAKLLIAKVTQAFANAEAEVKKAEDEYNRRRDLANKKKST